MQPTLPLDPSEEDLARDWMLTAEDLAETLRCRGDENRRRFAIQLCVLRAYGCFVDDMHRVPLRIANHLGRQLGIAPALFLAEPDRAATDTAHTQRIRAHLGYQAFDDRSSDRLKAVLEARASAGALTDELLAHACAQLRAWRVERPAPSTLDRLVAAIAARAETDAWRRIADRLSRSFCEAIDGLLVREQDGRSGLFRFKEYPPEPTAAAILTYLHRAEAIRDMNISSLDFSGVRPEAVAHLAELARRYDVDDLKRFAAPKRYAMVACFLADTQKTVLDHLVEMHHVFLTGLQRRARHAFDANHKQLRQRAPRNLGLVLDTLEALLAPDKPVAEVARELDIASVRAAIAACRELQRVTERGFVEELRLRHHLLKRYLPDFLRLPFEAEVGSEPLIAAIVIARELHAGTRATIGTDAPTGFAPPWLAAAVAGSDEGPDPRLWEIALAFAVRDALRSGALYLAESRHHVAFRNLLHGTEQWAEQRANAYEALSLPTETDRVIDGLQRDLDAAAEAFAKGLGDNSFARLHGGELAFSRRDALDIPPSVRELRRVIETNLPRIRVEDLLVEVDGWSGFTRELAPLGGYTPRGENHYAALLATLVAHGTNLGIATMAQSTKGLSADVLQHVSRWCLRPESLKAANDALVNHHHRLELASTWGAGVASSSDGQRFSVQESSLLAGFYPRHFGFYDRAVSVYTHVSDQFSVFASRVISCSPREALYVLDGLLENDTILRPREHYTDTHGFTEQLFGLCHLLGFSFMPRLKDLADQNLYKIDRARSYGSIDSIFEGVIDVALVREQWDLMVRCAASLRDRRAPAHVVLDKLAANARTDRFAKAVMMLGRVVKTTYLLRYMHDAKLRDRVHLQLNRGESRHELARRLFFANQGTFRSGDYEEIMNKVSALSVLSNAVLVWNTVRITEIVRALEAGGHVVAREDLARVSPLAHAHVIPSGTYRFPNKSAGFAS